MSKHTTKDRTSERKPATAEAQHPATLEELEDAAQANVGSDDDDLAGEPMDDAHPGMAFADDERAPVQEQGLSVDPEDLGREFLMYATEQDNFESELQRGRDPIGGGPPLGQVISEASVTSGGQEENEIPGSSALGREGDFDGREEAYREDVDLLSNVIREASLFDSPTERGGTRSPTVETDETQPTQFNAEAPEREAAEMRAHLRQHRDGGAERTETSSYAQNRARPGQPRAAGRRARAPRQ